MTVRYVNDTLGGETLGTDRPPMKVGAAFRCVHLIAGAIASMPLRYQSKDANGVYSDATFTRLYRLLRYRPNPTMSAFDFWRLAIKRMILDGVVYIVDRNDKLDLLLANQVVRDISGTYTSGGETFTEDKIVVLRYITPDGINFQGVNTYAGDAIKVAQAAESETYTRISTGALPKVFLKDNNIVMPTASALEKQRQRVSEAVQTKIGRTDSVAIIPMGFDFVPQPTPALDSQLPTLRDATDRDICRFYGVPPMLVYAEGDSNYKSAEMAHPDFLCNTLDPILRMIEAELLTKLIAPDFWDKDRFYFDREARENVSTTARADYHAKLLGLGYSVNDIRAMNDLKPVDGGEVVTVSANLKPINQL